MSFKALFFLSSPSKHMAAVVQPSPAQPPASLWVGCEGFGKRLLERRQDSSLKVGSCSPPDLHWEQAENRRCVGNAASVAVRDATLTWYSPHCCMAVVIRKKCMERPELILRYMYLQLFLMHKMCKEKRPINEGLSH